MGSKLAHGSPCFSVSVVLHEPTRRLGAKVDAGSKHKGRDERRAKFKAPGNPADILKNDVGAEAEEDAFAMVSEESMTSHGSNETYRL